jgi:hypothetical protein
MGKIDDKGGCIAADGERPNAVRDREDRSRREQIALDEKRRQAANWEWTGKGFPSPAPRTGIGERSDK